MIFSVDTIQICVEVLRVHYVLGVKRSFRFGKSIQFKLLGHPWRCGLNGHDGVHGRHMLCHLFHALAGCNWIPVISADASANYVEIENQITSTDVDSIFFTSLHIQSGGTSCFLRRANVGLFYTFICKHNWLYIFIRILFSRPRLNILIYVEFRLKIFLCIFLDYSVWHLRFRMYWGVNYSSLVSTFLHKCC